MKKTYNSPIVTIVEVKIQTALLEGSLEIKNANATSEGMSRGGSDWDDED